MRRPAHTLLVAIVRQMLASPKDCGGVEALYRQVHVKQGVFQIFMTSRP